ncbi:MAG TPA: arylsulfotransferase family protein [Solirubrobacteraceae bacterium]|nr:arylsulfotransferase family protein [Solirubrobacteraceae bacterium]
MRRTRRARRAGLGRATLVAVLLGTVLVSAAGARAAAAAGVVTISPLPGTPDASPSTQISFLGVPADQIRDVSVVGSASGRHSGRLEAYASAPGASFLLASPFNEGEQVKVSAVVGQGHDEQRTGTTFTVARLAHFDFTPMGAPPAGGPGTVQSFASRPELHPPAVRVTTRSPRTSDDDDVFIAANHGYGQWGPMIFERDGALVWFKPMPKGETAMDLRVEQYEGRPVLVWWQGNIAPLGVGFGTDYLYSSSYRPVARIRAGNGYWADLHEVKLTPAGSAFITAYSLVKADLSSIGGAREGALQDSLLQEIDVKTGLVMFGWHAYGHVAFSDSYSKRPFSQAWPWDFFHMNSISLDPSGDGDFLISARNTWAGYEIDHRTGAILWRLGGRHSSFRMGAGTGTAYQHDLRWQPDHTITAFDDGAVPKAHSESRAIHERIDWNDRTVSLTGRDVRSPGILTGSQGNDQVLAGGGSFVGWGEQPYVTEFSESGQTLFEANIPAPGESYRAYTYPWTGTPTSPPSVAVSPGAGETAMVYASWNGATGVSAWRVLAGPSPAQLAPIANAQKTGFETAIPVQSAAGDFAVQALGPAGQVLGTSPATAR